MRVENATNFSGVSSLGLCCGQFTSATSDRLTITVGGEWPLTQFFMVGFRLGNANYSDEFTATNSAPLIIGDEVKDVTYTTQMVTDIRGLNLDFVAKLFPVAGLWVSAGIRTSILVDRFATITVDSDVSAYRTSLNQGATYISGVGAIGYEIPLDSEGVFLLNPTIGASIGLSDYNSLDWKINTLSAQIGVVWQWGTKLIDEADSGDQFR
ncbi:MAG: hypothetical protein IPP80_07475 [Ignavibacteria bacterium]|nr:hypothetical protein [Ignavibacteria bacterium]